MLGAVRCAKDGLALIVQGLHSVSRPVARLARRAWRARRHGLRWRGGRVYQVQQPRGRLGYCGMVNHVIAIRWRRDDIAAGAPNIDARPDLAGAVAYRPPGRHRE